MKTSYAKLIKSHCLVLFAIMFAFGQQVAAQTAYRHTSDCWLEKSSNYGVSLSGVNPSLTQIHDQIRILSLKYNVPIEIIGAIAYHESNGLYQYGSDGFVVHNRTECRYCNDHGVINTASTDPPPGLGIMQLTGPTASASGNVGLLITDWKFNLEEGVKVLVNKYNLALAGDPKWMQQLERDNMLVLENWFYALRYYNGYKPSTDPDYLTYLNLIYGLIASPPADGRLTGLFTPVTVAKPESVIGNWIDGGSFVALPANQWQDKNETTYAGNSHESPSATIRAVSAATGTPVSGASGTFGGFSLQPSNSSGYFKVPAWLCGTKIFRVLRGNLLFDQLFSCPAPASSESMSALSNFAASPSYQLSQSELTVELASTLSVPTGTSTRFLVGDRVVVGGTTVGLRARYPDPSSDAWVVMPDGTTGTVVGGPTWSAGYFRWQIRYDSLPGLNTWSAEGEPDTGEFFLFPSGAASPISSIVINGPASLNENAAAQYSCEAHYADGTVQIVTPVWSENSSATSLSTNGLLSAGSVTSDTAVTVSASYTVGAITRTASKTVTVLNSGGSGPQNVELIVNGGFESGMAGWTMAGAVVKQNGAYPKSGSNYAILGETNNTVDVMYQQFTIPANATSATLNYYLNIVSAEATGMEYDIIETSLRTSSGNLLQLIEHKSNVNKAAGPGNPYYVKGSLDLTPWKGQTVRFHVLGQTDSNTLTSFKLDDVSAVAVLPAASQPTYPEIEITSGGEVIPHGSTGTDSNTDFGKHTMEQTTALRSFRVYNRGDGILNLTGSPKVRVVGSSSFILEEEPSASSVAAGEYVSFKIRFNPASGGIHQATVQVESNASNISNYTFAIRGEGVFFDGTPPVVTISSPTTGSAWSTGSGTLSLSGSAADNQQVGQVSWSNDRGGGGAATGTTSWSASGILLKSGLNVITVTALDGVGNISTDSLTVTYTPTTPEITVQPGTLAQSIARGSNGSSQTFTVANTGSGTMNYAVTVTSGASWLVVTPGNGTITSGQNTITVSYNTAALPAGAQAGTIQVAAAGAVNSPVTIPVSVNVSAVPPTTPWEGKWASGAATAEVVASAPAQGNGTLLVGTFSGSVTAGGQVLTSSGNEDFFVVKLDANRQAVWVKQFGGTDSEEIYSCQQHPAGGWVISGYFKSTFSMGSQSLTAAGNRDAFLARLDENGNVLWAKRGGGTGIDYGSFALVDGGGNCFLVGKFTTSANFTGGSTTLTANGTRFDLFVTKYSANGDFVWAKSCGGGQYDDVYCAAADANGNVYIGGIFELQAAYGPFTLTVQGNTASWDGFAAKFNASGTVVWAKRFGEPTGNSSTDYVQFISPGPDGGCYLGGGYDGPMSTEGKTLPRAAGISAFVGHVSPAGTLDWIVPIASSGAIGSIMRATHGMVVAAENSLVFGGSYHGEAVFGSSTLPLIGGPIGAENIYFGKIDASGAALWAIPAYSLDGSNLVSICPGNGERVKFFGEFGSPAYFPGLAPVNGDSSKHLVGEIGPPDVLSPPSLSDTANFLINEDTTTTVSFTLGDEDTPLGDLVVTAVSSNTSLVSPAGLSLSGAGASRQLGITPVANAYGDTTITLSVTDGVHSVSDTFVLTVVAVNDPPSKPANLLPANIAKNQWTTPLLEAGPYSDLEGDAHSASLWQILSTDGQVIIWDSGEDAVNKNNRSVAEGVLENGTTYQWRVRYKDSQGGWSAFSDSTSFSTVATYDSYRRQRFSQAERSAPAFSAMNADPEGDGMPNLLEYAFGSDPKAKDSETVRPSGGAQDGHLTFTYIRRTDTADIMYSVELSDDLIHWDSQPGMLEEVSVTPVDSNRERVTMRDASPMSSKSKRFVRLSVRQQ